MQTVQMSLLSALFFFYMFYMFGSHVNTTVSFVFFDLVFMFTGCWPVELACSHDVVWPRVKPVCNVWHLIKCLNDKCLTFERPEVLQVYLMASVKMLSNETN